ncbi:MAG: hypothetical protein WKF77_02440 [Planctomycetaceae bacterium]
MKSTKTTYTTLALLALTLCRLSNPVTAADVDARLSAQETWVGTPVVLQLSIHNAADYEQPAISDIDGCDIRSARQCRVRRPRSSTVAAARVIVS